MACEQENICKRVQLVCAERNPQSHPMSQQLSYGSVKMPLVLKGLTHEIFIFSHFGFDIGEYVLHFIRDGCRQTGRQSG